MRIVLVSASGLLAADRGGTSDPYAVLRLAGKKRKSKAIKKSLNPEWHEELEFPGEAEQMRALDIDLWDHDLIGSDDKLGTAKVDLTDCIMFPRTTKTFADVPLSTQGTVTLRATYVPRPPQIRGGDSQELGEDAPDAVDATFGSDIPTELLNGSLRVRLLSASSLLAADKGGTSDPYVKLIANGVDKKSPTIKKSLDPVWEGVEFEWIGPQTMLSTLELTVFDWDRVGKDDRLGSTLINLRTEGIFENNAQPVEIDAPLNTKGSVKVCACVCTGTVQCI
jgi:Ca2+-dependent lipid-binding protein